MVARLDERTRTYHGEAASDFDILYDTTTTHRDYILFLSRVYGFENPLEALLVSTPCLDRAINLRERAKASLLVADLTALGLRPAQITGLPQCLGVPQFRGVAEALGWMYVTERAALVHNVVRRHLHARLGNKVSQAQAYLGAYDGIVGARWKQFGQILDSVAREPAIAERIVEAACEAFRCQRRWITQDRTPVARTG